MQKNFLKFTKIQLIFLRHTLEKNHIIWYNILVCDSAKCKYYFRGLHDLGKDTTMTKNVKILRTDKGEFTQTVGLADETPDPIFQVSSVASANDCTGITVTVPNDDFEANSVAHLAAVNVTSKKSGK